MDSAVKIVVYIIVGATVIALAQSPNTGSAISAVTGGFANVLNAMRGGAGAGNVSQAPQGSGSPFAASSVHM